MAMEAAAQLEARSLSLHLEWTPRTVNQEADDLANGEFAAFDSALRVHFQLADA